MRRLTDLTGLTFAVLTMMPALVRAQSGTQPTNPVAQAAIHDARCAWAARIVARGQTSASSDDEQTLNDDGSSSTRKDPLFIVSGCGVVGSTALAAGMTQLAHETDIDKLNTFMYIADSWRDGGIFSSALRLAADPSASPQARVFAVRHLIVLSEPHVLYSYGGLTAGETTTREADGSEISTLGCHAVLKSEKATRVGSPLPADYQARIQNALNVLKSSSSTPAPVRNAALCLR